MRNLLILFSILALWSCANSSVPAGGPDDKTPPVLKKSQPLQETVFFNEGGFQLEFDEIIVLDNVNSQLVVSPPLAEKPDIKSMKNRVTVKFNKEDLQENTTYSFNFGLAITDYNAGNILKNFKYVFSTGSYIDSLQMDGEVIDAFTEEPVENVAVLMYRNLEDSMPLTSLPNYFGISDENGHYSISNIKNGSYKLFALVDMNQNYIFDQPDEKIAFFDEIFVLDSNISGVKFKAFTEANDKQFIIQRDVKDYGALMYTFNQPLENLKIILKDEIFALEDYRYKLYPNRDTLKIWFPDYKDTFTLILKEDSTYSDTLEMDVTPVFSIEEMPPFSITPNLSGIVDLNKTLILRFENPIVKWEPEFISLHEDSIKIDLKPYFKDSLKTELLIPYTWKESSKYHLLIGLGTFVDFYEQKNDIYELRFGAQEESFYGIINLSIDLGDTKAPYIFELLDKDLNKIAQKIIRGNETFRDKFLRPGEYNFRLIQDLNDNGKWDAGEYESHTQPEPVIYYPTPTAVRSNWEIDLDWGIELE